MSQNFPVISKPRSLRVIEDQPSATKAEVTRCLGRLFAAFHTADAGDMVDLRMAVYFEALQGLPASSIDTAVHEFLTGQIPEHDGRFLPTCAQIAKRARHHADRDRAMAARAGRERVQVESREDDGPRKDPGFRQLADLLRAHRADNEPA